MIVYSFEWDTLNENHIAAHGVFPFEVEEGIVLDKPFYQKGREGKYVAYTVTKDGRYLFIVFALKPHRCIRVITTRDMTEKEKRYYRKRKRSQMS